MTWWMWLLAALLLGIIEVLSITFVFLMFAIGAVAAAITAFFGGGLIAQVVVFVVVSLIVMRPLMKGRIQRSGDDVRTNADALIGKSGYVTQLVGERDGRIQFSGGEWSARSTGELIPVGTQIEVVAIEGATAVVRPLTNQPLN